MRVACEASVTGLRGWGGRARTRKWRRKLSLWKVAAIPGIEPQSGHRGYSRLSCGIEETQLGPRAAGSRQASDRALDDQAAGAQHISLGEARRRVPASSAPHRKQLAGAEHGGSIPSAELQRTVIR